MIVMRRTPAGIPVKSIDVPEVDARSVPNCGRTAILNSAAVIFLFVETLVSTISKRSLSATFAPVSAV